MPCPLPALAGRTVASVACGDTHTLVATDDGQLFSFGRNQSGQLGLGSIQDSLLPQPVLALQVGGRLGACIVLLHVGMLHLLYPSCAAITQPALLHPSNPLAAAQGKRVLRVACGAEHSLCATDDGEVFAFGWGRYGEWALQQGVSLPSSLQLRTCALRVVAAAVTCAVSSIAGWHKLEAWQALRLSGRPHPVRPAGNIGDGEAQDRHMPTKVKGLDGVKVAKVACGWRHRCARCLRVHDVLLSRACGEERRATWGDNNFARQGFLPTLHPHMRAASRLTTRARCTPGAGAPGRSSCTATASERQGGAAASKSASAGAHRPSNQPAAAAQPAARLVPHNTACCLHHCGSKPPMPSPPLRPAVTCTSLSAWRLCLMWPWWPAAGGTRWRRTGKAGCMLPAGTRWGGRWAC